MQTHFVLIAGEVSRLPLWYSFTIYFQTWGYWHQRADERLSDPPPKVDPGAFSGQRQGWKTPARGSSWDGRPQEDSLGQCTASVCSGSALLGDLLVVSRSSERDLLSVLSIYPRIFLCVFIVYRRIVRILCLLLYSAIMLMCVGCFNVGLVASTWQVIGYIKTPLMTPS